MLPLGVVIPTKNSMPYLPRHMAGLRPWLDLVAEVVVVDSFSTDGTVEYLRAELAHPRVRFVSHPPGLYASWNHGIAQVAAPLTYLATAGDTITRAGLETLVQAATDLTCDVVVSKPDFVAPDGSAIPDIPWPVDDIVATLGITAPRRLHKLEALVFAAVHLTGALTGSCASCVFRTATLRRLPFPTEFGTVGDGAWGVRHATEVTWGIVPGRFSTFLMHPPSATEEDRQSYPHSRRMDEVLREGVARWLREGSLTRDELDRIHWDDLERTVTEHLAAKSQYDRQRRAHWPWLLNPAAWLARTRRQQSQAALRALKQAALRQTCRVADSPAVAAVPAAAGASCENSTGAGSAMLDHRPAHPGLPRP